MTRTDYLNQLLATFPLAAGWDADGCDNVGFNWREADATLRELFGERRRRSGGCGWETPRDQTGRWITKE